MCFSCDYNSSPKTSNFKEPVVFLWNMFPFFYRNKKSIFKILSKEKNLNTYERKRSHNLIIFIFAYFEPQKILLQFFLSILLTLLTGRLGNNFHFLTEAN